MRCYLIRHGRDNETIRGGWSQHPLTLEGIMQAETLSSKFACNQDRLKIKCIYTSDLTRAVETAQILAKGIHLDIVPLSEFRETNNGDLAGMDNDLALIRYPGLFWNQMEWEQCYPNGESPKMFYERISNAWSAFSENIVSSNENAALVTHGGVIQVILSIIHNKKYSNQQSFRRVPYAGVIILQYENGSWCEVTDHCENPD